MPQIDISKWAAFFLCFTALACCTAEERFHLELNNVIHITKLDLLKETAKSLDFSLSVMNIGKTEYCMSSEPTPLIQRITDNISIVDKRLYDEPMFTNSDKQNYEDDFIEAFTIIKPLETVRIAWQLEKENYQESIAFYEERNGPSELSVRAVFGFSRMCERDKKFIPVTSLISPLKNLGAIQN